MADTPEQQEARQKRFAAARQPAEGYRRNPTFGDNPFDPNAYLPVVESNPQLAEPLPQSRYIDPRMLSQTAVSRAQDIQALRKNPEKWVQENAAELNNEQSLMDRGKTMLSRIFDYEDEADAQLFGINLSSVESVWDTSIRYLTGAYDLLNVGFGGLISAAPGGLRTLSYDELSGGKSVTEVLSGEMEPGSAPSPGQIAVASVALEAKRIREGKTRLSDILLLNPATAPFLIAGVAADTSPLQQEGFDIMNKEQRERAFGAGWEQWMSGITDVGLMFADPGIGAGVAVKVVRAGRLGARTAVKQAAELGVASNDAVDKITTLKGDLRTPEQFYDEVAQAAPDNPPGTTLRQLKETGKVPPAVYDIPQIYDDMPIPSEADIDNILAPTYMRIAQKSRETGQKVMSTGEIENMPEIRALTNRGYVAKLLHDADNVYEVALVFEALTGVPQAMNRLGTVAPYLADQVLSIRRMEIAQLRMMEPAKVADSGGYLERAAANLQNDMDTITKQIDFFEQRLRKISPDDRLSGVSVDQASTYTLLKQQKAVLQKSLDETNGLYRMIKDGEMPDILDQRSPWFKADEADRILDDLHRRQEWFGRLNDEIFDAAIGARFTVPTRNTAYARMVVGSRARRTKSAYQYSVEKTSWIPRRRLVESAAGGQKYEWDFWGSSQFEGVSRLQRNARVWRWLGTETPSGYIGLKGTATVGTEREFNAALDLDVYRGDPIKVTVLEEQVIVGKNGAKQTVMVPMEREFGGRARKEELFNQFYAALNNPAEDAMTALQAVEREVLHDLRMLFGYHSAEAKKVFDDVLNVANKNRAVDLQRLRDGAPIVDDGTTHYVPYLETHLANGTYMQNFQALEKMLRKDSIESKLKGVTSKVERSLTIPANIAGSTYELFNDLWRPATLLRLSYTQRNVFEGMVRAMAYSASVAPLSWPIRATYNGTRNKIVSAATKRKVAIAERAIQHSEFGEVWREYTKTNDEFYRLARALEVPDPQNPKKTVMRIIDRKPGEPSRVETMSVAEYKKRVDDVKERRAAGEELVKSNEVVKKFDAAVQGTAFGKWREAQIKDLNIAILNGRAMEDRVREKIKDAEDAGVAIDIFEDQDLLDWFGTHGELYAQAAKKRDLLMQNPLAAMHEYNAVAGRQRRIGSGTSMGPDGNQYGDAWSGPLETINRNLMSADGSTKQKLSLDGTVFGNIFLKVLVRNNPMIQYSDRNIDAWAQGMVDAIEDASSSRVIRMLMETASDDFTTFDVDRVINWMISDDPEARTFTTRLMSMFGSDPVNPISLEDVARTVPDEAVAPATAILSEEQGRLKRFAEDTRTVSGQTRRTYDPEKIDAYVKGVLDILQTQMQGNRDFWNLLRERIAQKGDKVAATPGISADDVKRIIRAMPVEQRNQLGFIQGSEMVQAGMNGPMEFWAKAMNGFFKYLGTMPEDAVTRGPFYNMRYKQVRNELIEVYWQRAEPGKTIKEIRAANKQRTQSGRPEDGTIEHPEFKIPAKELSRIEVLAHRRALMDTREWMYTIERRTKLGKYGEWIFPFISATQNTATVTGKLLWKEPWLAPMIATIWQMPNRLGIEDENGNLRLPMPLPWVRDMLKDNPDIPFLGGAIDSSDTIIIPKNGLNVWMPETGFGVIPTPHAWVQVGASEMMKAGAFPIETPPIFTQLFGEDTGNQLYTSLKDWIFGEGQGMSDKLASWDMLFPAATQKLIYMRDEMSAQYGYQYAMQALTQRMRFRGQERDTAPDEAEIHKRATNMFWFQFFGNVGLPTPLTPYPILTRPQVQQTPILELQNIYGKLRQADPINASMNMNKMFGDWALEAALTKITKSPGGAAPTAETVSDIQTLQPLIRTVAPELGENLDVLGILVNNRGSRSEYNESAYQWQKSENIAGRGETWRMVQTPEMSDQERQRIVGWTVWRQFKDQLDAKLQNAGFESYEQKGAEAFKAAKETFVLGASMNPDLAAWYIDYQDLSGNRTGAAIRTMTAAVSDPGFVELMVKSGKERTLSAMHDYLYNRDMVRSIVEATGKSIDHDDNLMIKQAWAKIQQQLVNSDERFGEIFDLYLTNDTATKGIGVIVDPNAPLPVGVE